jgi:phosphate transport system substrate-binding protein
MPNFLQNAEWGCRTVVVCAMLAAAGCGRHRESFTLAGSTAFQPFAEKLADQYMAGHPEVSINIQGGGSAMGIYAAVSGAAQIGMADLVKLPKEADPLKHIVVAREGIAIVLNPANAVSSLTLEQIRGIFSGTIKSWKEVGGTDRAIAVISREAGSGTRASFEQIVGGVTLTPDALIQDSNGTIRETVANDAHAIGYLAHGLVNEKVKPVQVDGCPCSEEAIASGGYKLIRPVFLVYRPDVSPACQAFLDYLLSDEAQELLHTNGLIRAL